MQEDQTFDQDAFRHRVDPTLHAHLDYLLRMGTQKPLANGIDLEHSLNETVLRGRKQRLNREITQMTYLQSQAKQEENLPEIQSLSRRVHSLSEELGRIEQQLNELTVLWRSRGES
jgi:hypothetical protein